MRNPFKVCHVIRRKAKVALRDRETLGMLMLVIVFFDRRNGKGFVVIGVMKDMDIIVFFLEVTVVREVKESVNE